MKLAAFGTRRCLEPDIRGEFALFDGGSNQLVNTQVTWNRGRLMKGKAQTENTF
jgi:hypothetical protein